MTVTFEDSLKVESISKNGKFKCIMEPYPGNELDFKSISCRSQSILLTPMQKGEQFYEYNESWKFL